MTAETDLLPLLALLDIATPGPWRWSMNGNIVPDPHTDDCEIAAVYSEHMDDVGVPANAAAIIGAVNFLRTHGANLAELQREVEGLREYKRVSDECNESLRTFVKVEEARTAAAEARAERLAGALREIANQGPHYGPDGTYKTWRHWAEIARAALDQETTNG